MSAHKAAPSAPAAAAGARKRGRPASAAKSGAGTTADPAASPDAAAPFERQNVTVRELAEAPWLFQPSPTSAPAAAAAGAAPPPAASSSLSPALVRQLAREVDPALRLSDGACEEVLAFVDAFLARLVSGAASAARRRSRDAQQLLEASASLSEAVDLAHAGGPRAPTISASAAAATGVTTTPVVLTPDDVSREVERLFPLVLGTR